MLQNWMDYDNVMEGTIFVSFLYHFIYPFLAARCHALTITHPQFNTTYVEEYSQSHDPFIWEKLHQLVIYKGGHELAAFYTDSEAPLQIIYLSTLLTCFMSSLALLTAMNSL